MSPTDERTVRLVGALHLLQINEEDFNRLLRTHSIPLVSTVWGPSIRHSDLMRLAHLPEIPDLARSALLANVSRLERLASPVQQERLNKLIEAQLNKYDEVLNTLVRIHSKYDSRIRPVFSESPEAAAYVLLARGFSVMRLLLTGLRNKQYQAIILLRLIDEAVHLAEYFLVEKDTSQGKRNLTAWYRENRSPKQSVCRQSIDRWAANLVKLEGMPSMLSISGELYDAKSKPVHHARISIMEHYRTGMADGRLVGLGFDTDTFTDLGKLYELVIFVQSSLWTLEQALSMCFRVLHPILDPTDVETLTKLDRQFNADLESRRRGPS